MGSTLPVVLILGAGPNIGLNVAKEFAANGYKAVVTSRKPPQDENGSWSYVQGDLSNPNSVIDIFSQVRKLCGEPSVVVYNGISSLTLSCILAASSQWYSY
jgi:NAD(P)-dependent dehydrogenase (short-subunit alcohol dehydrogenase family)